MVMEKNSRSEETSMSEMTLSLTSSKLAISLRLECIRCMCVRLLTAIGAAPLHWWLGLRSCLEHGRCPLTTLAIPPAKEKAKLQIRTLPGFLAEQCRVCPGHRSLVGCCTLGSSEELQYPFRSTAP